MRMLETWGTVVLLGLLMLVIGCGGDESGDGSGDGDSGNGSGGDPAFAGAAILLDELFPILSGVSGSNLGGIPPAAGFSLECEPGEVIVGMDYNITAEDGFINGLRVVCAPVSIDGDGLVAFGAPLDGDEIGTFDNPTPAFAQCADISGVNGFNDKLQTIIVPPPFYVERQRLTSVALSCAPMYVDSTGSGRTEAASLGEFRGATAAGADVTGMAQTCADGEYATAVWGKQNSGEFREFNLVCSSLQAYTDPGSVAFCKRQNLDDDDYCLDFELDVADDGIYGPFYNELGAPSAAPWRTADVAKFTHGNDYTARSGDINFAQASRLQLSLFFTDTGTISFDWLVDAAPGSGQLSFFIDGVIEFTGQPEGFVQRYTSPSLSKGQHTFLFSFSKPGDIDIALDALLIDNIVATHARYWSDIIDLSADVDIDSIDGLSTGGLVDWRLEPSGAYRKDDIDQNYVLVAGVPEDLSAISYLDVSVTSQPIPNGEGTSIAAGYYVEGAAGGPGEMKVYQLGGGSAEILQRPNVYDVCCTGALGDEFDAAGTRTLSFEYKSENDVPTPNQRAGVDFIVIRGGYLGSPP